MTETIFGLDLSGYQTGFPMHRAKQQDFRFVYLKATEGQGYADPEFSAHLARARQTGMLTAAYHFLRSDSAPEAQADNFWNVVGNGLPCIVDVEPTSDGVSKPGMPHAHAFTHRLRERGYHRRISLYYPRWWWERTGSRDFPHDCYLVGSDYGDNPSGHASVIYPGDTSPRWNGYGGHTPLVLQFGSRGIVDGYTGGVDVNAYRGSVDELAKLGIFADFRRHRHAGEVPTVPDQRNGNEHHTLAERVRRLERRVSDLEKRMGKG